MASGISSVAECITTKILEESLKWKEERKAFVTISHIKVRLLPLRFKIVTIACDGYLNSKVFKMIQNFE